MKEAQEISYIVNDGIMIPEVRAVKQRAKAQRFLLEEEEIPIPLVSC